MKKSRLLFNFLVFLSIYNLIVGYIIWNGWAWLSTTTYLSSINIYVYSITLAIIAYSYLLHRYLKNNVLKVIGAFWFGIVQYSLILLPVANLAIAFLYFLPVERNAAVYWTGNIVLLLFLILFIYGAFNAYSPVVRKYRISIPKKAGSHKLLRIAVASDMHFGVLSGKNHAERLVRILRNVKPDLVLFPGDIIDDDPKPFTAKNIHYVLQEIKAPLGVYGILGNHEYYGGAIKEYTNIMKKINIPILQDEVILLDNTIYLVGRKDRTAKNRHSIEVLMENVDKSLPVILMDHQPHQLNQAMENGVDISVSGHTHRGQMAPNHLITRKMFELDWGYKQKEQLHAFVSSGFGFWGPPLRIGSRSEVVQIDVEFKTQGNSG